MNNANLDASEGQGQKHKKRKKYIYVSHRFCKYSQLNDLMLNKQAP